MWQLVVFTINEKGSRVRAMLMIDVMCCFDCVRWRLVANVSVVCVS